jgi:hypothetical protein
MYFAKLHIYVLLAVVKTVSFSFRQEYKQWVLLAHILSRSDKIEGQIQSYEPHLKFLGLRSWEIGDFYMYCTTIPQPNVEYLESEPIFI